MIGPKPNRSPMCRNKRSGTMHLCECAHFFAQLFWNSKRLQRTCHANEMLGHTVERAVQWADAGIDGQVTIDTDPLSFRSQTATQKKTQSKNSEASNLVSVVAEIQSCFFTDTQIVSTGCRHCPCSTIDRYNESAYSQLAVPDSLKNRHATATSDTPYSDNQVQSHVRDQHRQTQI